MEHKKQVGSVTHTKIPNSKVVENYYQLGRSLGEGTYGEVIDARNRASGVLRAIKIITKNKDPSTGVKSYEKEAHILRQINHPNIVRLIEIMESNHRMFFVLELCTGGTLSTELKNGGAFIEADCQNIMHQIAEALCYLHKKRIVHRDIKLDNILIHEGVQSKTLAPGKPIVLENSNNRYYNNKKKNNLLSTPIYEHENNTITAATKSSLSNNSNRITTVKLSDFGLSIELRNVEDTLVSFAGTPTYMAPEILLGKCYTQQCDMWSLGIILFTLIMGKLPFNVDNTTELNKEIQAFSDENLKVLPKDKKKLHSCISRLLHRDPAYRYSSSELIHDPWITGHDTTTGETVTNVLELMKQFKKNSTSQVSNNYECNNGNIEECDLSKPKHSSKLVISVSSVKSSSL